MLTALLLLAAATLPPEEVRLQPQATAGDPRSQRPWVISAEAGWNSLAGVGVTVARHLAPEFTLEAGLGGSGEGPKLGMRARYNFLVQEATPFLGAGFLYGTGTTGGSGSSAYTVGPSPFLQFTGGIDYQSRAGMSCVLALGYAILLRQNFSGAQQPGRDYLTGGGVVFSLSLGYAF